MCLMQDEYNGPGKWNNGVNGGMLIISKMQYKLN